MGSLGTAETKIENLEKNLPKMDVGLIQRKTVGALLKPNAESPKLFTPLTIRGATFQNRIFVSFTFWIFNVTFS